MPGCWTRVSRFRRYVPVAAQISSILTGATEEKWGTCFRSSASFHEKAPRDLGSSAFKSGNCLPLDDTRMDSAGACESEWACDPKPGSLGGECEGCCSFGRPQSTRTKENLRRPEQADRRRDFLWR